MGRARTVTAICLLAACVGGGLGWAFRRPASSDERKKPSHLPPVIILPEALDFHMAWESEAFPWQLALQNISEKPVTVREVRGVCDCTRTEGGKEVVLNPGEWFTVSLVIDLLQLRAHDPAEVRVVEVPVFVTVNSGEAGVSASRWSLRGRVRRLIRCEPLQLGLGDELSCGEAGRTREFRLHMNSPHQRLRLKRVPEGWTAALLPAPDEARDYVLRASPCKRKVGPFADFFTLEVIDADGRVRPAQPIKVEGRVTDGVEVLPRPLDLGEVVIGTTARARLWLSERNGDTIEAVEPARREQSAKWIAGRPDGQKWRIDLEQMIDASGGGSCSGVFRVKLHAGGWREVKYLLRWYGISN